MLNLVLLMNLALFIALVSFMNAYIRANTRSQNI